MVGNTELMPETIYDPERAHLKIILVGAMETNASLLNVIKALLES